MLIPGAVGPHRVLHPRAEGGDKLQESEPAQDQQPPDIPVNGRVDSRERDDGDVIEDVGGLGENNGDQVVGTRKRVRKKRCDSDFVYY